MGFDEAGYLLGRDRVLHSQWRIDLLDMGGRERENLQWRGQGWSVGA